MYASSLSITGVRNLHSVILELSPQINIFFGSNGSGKTSLLESIYFLGLAKTFRSQHTNTIISDGFSESTVFSKIQSDSGNQVSVGVSRTREQSPSFGFMRVRVNGENIRSTAVLADHFPLQLINSDDFKLLEGGAKQRRHFLDWGLFHLEPEFFKSWKNIQHILRQRNAYLRHNMLNEALLDVWTHELSNAADQLDNYRMHYLSALRPVFETVLSHLMPDIRDLSFSYYRGWDKGKPLAEVLNASLARDQRLGYTQAGPHRADLRLRIRGKNVVDVFSRGQQKLAVCAMRASQAYLLAEQKQKKCVFLIDDLPSELDTQSQKALCGLLERLEAQVFITCIDPGVLKTIWLPKTSVAMFHVEHGRVHPWS